jgi:hypothetical protein
MVAKEIYSNMKSLDLQLAKVEITMQYRYRTPCNVGKFFKENGASKIKSEICIQYDGQFCH